MQVLVISVIIDLIFYDLGKDFRSVQNRNGILFEINLLALVFGSQNASLVFPTERPLFVKETSQRIYGPGSYYIAKSISEIPYIVIAMTLQALIVYWALGLNDYNANKFFIFWGAIVVLHLVGTG